MEKVLKVVRTIAILLIVVLISVASFCGVYVQDIGIWKNVMPKYTLGMELEGVRELSFVLDDSEVTREVYVDDEGNYKGDVVQSMSETSAEATDASTEVDTSKYKTESRLVKANPNELITIENLNKTKKIIQRRLEASDQYEYNIRQDSVTGAMVLEVPDDENVELKKALVLTQGRITIEDAENGYILVDDSNIKNATVTVQMLNSEDVESEETTEEEHEHEHEAFENETYEYHQLYLVFEFDEEGSEIMKKISDEYIMTVDDTGAQTAKQVAIKFDEETLIETYFGETLEDGAVQIPIGEPISDHEEYYQAGSSLQTICDIINDERLPLSYVLSSDNYVQSSITDNTLVIMNVIVAVVILVVSIYMIIKYKLNGLKQAILSVGYVAVLLLVVRLVGVTLTMNSLIACGVVILINYIFGMKFLKHVKDGKSNKESLKHALKELYLSIVPVCVIAVIMLFMSSLIISSMGMMLFWGLLVQVLFSVLVLI